MQIINRSTFNVESEILTFEAGFNALPPDARFPSTTRFMIASKAKLASLLKAIQEPLRVFLLAH